MARISIYATRLFISTRLSMQESAARPSSASRWGTSHSLHVAWVLLLVAMTSLCVRGVAQAVEFKGVEATLPVTPAATLQAAAVVVDGNGNVYVSDFGNKQVVELMPSGGAYTQTVVISTSNAGSGSSFSPRGLTLDSGGNLYVADYGGNQILKVPCPAGVCGTPSALVSGLSNGPQDVAFNPYGYIWFTMSGDANVWSIATNGTGLTNYSSAYWPSTPFSQPTGLAWQTTGGGPGTWTGNLFISDYTHNSVTEWTWNGVAWVLATPQPAPILSNPTRMAVDAVGDLYIADMGNNRVVKIPWTGTAWGTQITVPTSPLNQPVGVALDGSGNIYIADWMNHRVLKESAAMNFGAVPVGTTSSSATAYFSFTAGGTLGSVSVLTQGVAGLDFADTGAGTCTTGHNYNPGDSCSVVFNFTPSYAGARFGAVVLDDNSGNVLATAYLYGTGAGPQIDFMPLDQMGAPLSESVLSVSGTGTPDPVGIATDTAGDVYIADTANGQVVKLAPAGGGGYTQVTVATGLLGPRGVAVDGAGNVYIADLTGGKLYQVPWNGGSYGSLTPLPIGAGHTPAGVAVDGLGDVFFTDGATNYAGVLQGGVLTQLTLTGVTQPSGLAFDAYGDLFVTDITGNQVVELPAANFPWTGAWGTPTTAVTSGAGLSGPARFGIDPSGSLYIADSGNHRVAKVACTSASVTPCTTWGTPTTVPTGLAASDSAYDAALDSAGNLYIAVYSGNPRALMEDYADAPSLSFAPTEVSATSSDSPHTVDIGNIGNQTLSLEGGAPAIPPDFDLTGSSCSTSLEVTGLLPSQSCGLSVTFNPWQAGNPLTEDLTLEDNNLNAVGPSWATQTLQFSGVAYAQPLLSPSSANFSQVQTTTSNGWTFNLSNTGNVPFTGITISIANVLGVGAHIPVSLTGVFAIQSTACGGTLSGDGQTVTGASLGAYSSCNIVVTFTPPATGDASDSYTGKLQITDSSNGDPVTASLSGTGTAIQVDLSPGSFDFGSGTIGSTWQTQTATLTNASGGTLTVNSVTIATTGGPAGYNQAFSISSTTCGTGTVLGLASSFTVIPYAHCTITMAFAPTVPGTNYTGTLTVSDNGSPAAPTVALSGAATGQAVWLSPTTIPFSNQTAGSVSNPWTVTLNNSTNAAIAIHSIGIGGFNAADFGETNDCGAIPGTLPANTTCHIYVTFQPQSQGTFHGSLDVSYGSTPTTVSATLTGTGTAVTAALAPNQLNFGSVVDDGASTTTQTATLTNTSGGSLGHISPSISLGGAVFTIGAGGNTCPVAPAALAHGASCIITVTFKPNAVQTFHGTLTVTDDAGTQTSSLLGVGTSASAGGSVYFSPASINFGNQIAGTTSSPWGMSLNNTGSASITFPPTGLVLSDPTNFSLVPSNACAGVTLGPGNSVCNFQVEFNPPVPWPPAETTLPVTPAVTLQPAAVVVDSNGDIFASDFGNNQVVELKPAGGTYTQTVVANSGIGGLASPRGLTLDSSDNLYIADFGGNKILKVACPAGVCGAPSVLISGLSNGPQDMSFDPYGYIWFTMSGDAQVWSIATDGTGLTNYSQTYWPSTPFSQPVGLAWHTTGGGPGTWTGNLFISDYNNNSVTEWTWNGGAWVLASPQPAASLTTPTRMAVDSAGDLYIADTGNNRIVKIPWTGSAWSTQITIPTSALNQPVGVALDGSGNLYIADWQNHRVLKETFGALGAKSATLSATYTGGGGGTVTASLTGTSVGSNVAISPSSLDFGDQVQGTTSAAKTVTVTDTNNGPVAILSIGVSDSTNFMVSGGTCTTSTVLTKVSPSCTIQVEFTPHAAHAYSGATLNIIDTATGSPQTVALTGTGVSNTPSAYFSPSSINFGNQTLGSTSSPWGVTLNNNGNVTINPSGVSVSVGSSDFAIPAGTNHCATLTSLAPGAACSFQVTFTPSVGGTRNGTIVAGGSSPLNTITASLTGNGNGATISISPSSLNFGNVVQGSGPTSAQFVTVTNTSGGTLTIANPNGIAVTSPYNLGTGANACSNGTHLTGAGASCKIYVTFSPATLGTLNGTLTVASDASNGSQTVNLYGTGVAVGSHIITASNYTLSADPSSLTLQAGQKGTVAFTLAPVNGYKGTVALSCGDLPFGVTCNFSPTSLTADGRGTLQMSQLTISTIGNNQNTAATDRSRGEPTGIALAGILLWPGLILGGILAWQRKRLSGQVKLVLLAAVLLFTFAGGTGCSGIHFNSTPEGTHAITITASASAPTSGGATTTQTGTFTLTVSQ